MHVCEFLEGRVLGRVGLGWVGIGYDRGRVVGLGWVGVEYLWQL